MVLPRAAFLANEAAFDAARKSQPYYIRETTVPPTAYLVGGVPTVHPALPPISLRGLACRAMKAGTPQICSVVKPLAQYALRYRRRRSRSHSHPQRRWRYGALGSAFCFSQASRATIS